VISRDDGPAPLYRPGTLAVALQAESDGLGAVRFVDGRPYWVPGAKPRFREDEE
jgi:hypothetical protein